MALYLNEYFFISYKNVTFYIYVSPTTFNIPNKSLFNTKDNLTYVKNVFGIKSM